MFLVLEQEGKLVIKKSVLTVCLLASAVVGAQTQQEQLNNLNAAQNQILSAEQARQADIARQQYEAQQQAEKRAAQQRAQQQKIQAEQLAIQKQREAAAEEAARERKYEQQKDKDREQAYQDKLRQQEIEAREADLAMKKAKAKRADDFAEQALNREKAQTDVIQSEADATRNISEGSKNLQTGQGQGAAKANSGWFK